eukprot:CAMPEP_0117448140 /NCGR_PEP_ID=MMETSP0759-20121206/7244_1 /TAXON_ID=63605 /ORGANISM="Percolomonas cosmopolitus, Strain WS" /LENGTH=128 /DNA_ID=CAMNT_0005240511 /DNA_START=27 /DNA_END=413 /DNA_ORIENTATION=-
MSQPTPHNHHSPSKSNSSNASLLFTQAQQILALSSNMQPALNLFAEALDGFERDGDLVGKEKCYQEMALCHMMSGNYHLAKDMYQSSLKLFAQKNDIILPGVNDSEEKKRDRSDDENDNDSETFITNR